VKYEWREGTCFALSLQTPAGTTATVCLPAVSADQAAVYLDGQLMKSPVSQRDFKLEGVAGGQHSFVVSADG